jgi:hypothetical protein
VGTEGHELAQVDVPVGCRGRRPVRPSSPPPPASCGLSWRRRENASTLTLSTLALTPTM